MVREQEFRDFFSAEYPALRGLAYLLTRDWTQAEDLAQEAMVRTYRAWSRIRDRERPAVYARTVLVNRHRSLLRRGAIEARHRFAGRDEPQTSYESREDRIVVRDAIGRLPIRQRHAVVLRYFEDLPESEVAQIMDCPVGTVKSLVHRGLRRLRAGLDPAAGPSIDEPRNADASLATAEGTP